eukprot:GEMP01041437.1.p1 GENE.GEMP01041437.1~~GEMP01041437.1.p1  ORF type:complete len:276 (+),score=71.18 GEMP01041437.1:53-880(+)
MVFPRAAKPVRMANVRLSLQKPYPISTVTIGAKSVTKGGKKGMRTAPTFAPVRKTLQFQPLKVANPAIGSIRLNTKGIKGGFKGNTPKGKGKGKGKLAAPLTLFTPKPRVATFPIRAVTKRTTFGVPGLSKPFGVRHPLLKQNILNPAKKFVQTRPTVHGKGLRAPLAPAFLKPVKKGVISKGKGFASKGKGFATTVTPMVKILSKNVHKGTPKGKGAAASFTKGKGKKGPLVATTFKPLTLIKPQFKPLQLSKPSFGQKSGKAKGKGGKGKGKK